MRRLKIKNNKRGQIQGILIFMAALGLLLLVGAGASLGVAFVDWVADETVPELTDLGDTGDGWSNFTEIASMTVTPANNFIQALPWVVGVLYIMCLFGTLGLAFAFRFSGMKWLMILFFGLMITLILAAITVSIIYEDFYDDSGGLGEQLKDQVLMSFLILYSPMIFTVIGFVGAIIMFTGMGEVLT